MSKVSETARRWKAFTADRQKARVAMQRQHTQMQEQIDALRAQISKERSEFDAHWAEVKDTLRTERDEAIKDAWREGQTGTWILKEMVSNNTKLIYGLRDDLLAEGFELPTTEHEDAEIKGVTWRSHRHAGVHGWLLNEDGSLYKHYTDANTSYIAERDTHEFVAGSKKAYDTEDRDEAEAKLAELEALLDGSFEGTLDFSKPNPHTA